jgi:hypothetical protein
MSRVRFLRPSVLHQNAPYVAILRADHEVTGATHAPSLEAEGILVEVAPWQDAGIVALAKHFCNEADRSRLRTSQVHGARCKSGDVRRGCT